MGSCWPSILESEALDLSYQCKFSWLTLQTVSRPYACLAECRVAIATNDKSSLADIGLLEWSTCQALRRRESKSLCVPLVEWRTWIIQKADSACR